MAGRCAPGYINTTPNAINATCVKSPTVKVGGSTGASTGGTSGVRINPTPVPKAAPANARVPGSTPSCAAAKVAFYIQYYSGKNVGYSYTSQIMLGYSDSMAKMAKEMKSCNSCATTNCENLAKLVAKAWIKANPNLVSPGSKPGPPVDECAAGNPLACASKDLGKFFGGISQGVGNQASNAGLGTGNFLTDLSRFFGQSASSVGQQIQFQQLMPYIIIGGVAIAALALIFKR